MTGLLDRDDRLDTLDENARGHRPESCTSASYASINQTERRQLCSCCQVKPAGDTSSGSQSPSSRTGPDSIACPSDPRTMSSAQNLVLNPSTRPVRPGCSVQSDSRHSGARSGTMCPTGDHPPTGRRYAAGKDWTRSYRLLHGVRCARWCISPARRGPATAGAKTTESHGERVRVARPIQDQRGTSVT
jgi:hypothetical protein